MNHEKCGCKYGEKGFSERGHSMREEYLVYETDRNGTTHAYDQGDYGEGLKTLDGLGLFQANGDFSHIGEHVLMGTSFKYTRDGEAISYGDYKEKSALSKAVNVFDKAIGNTLWKFFKI